MDREITWEIVRARYRFEDGLLCLEKRRKQLHELNRRSERLIIAVLALGVLLLAVHLESLAPLGQ